MTYSEVHSWITAMVTAMLIATALKAAIIGLSTWAIVFLVLAVVFPFVAAWHYKQHVKRWMR